MSLLPKHQSDTYKEIGRRLTMARLEQGLTQEDVAELIGKPQSFLSRLENGERRIDIVETAHLARLYGKPLVFFDVSDGVINPDPIDS